MRASVEELPLHATARRVRSCATLKTRAGGLYHEEEKGKMKNKQKCRKQTPRVIYYREMQKEIYERA